MPLTLARPGPVAAPPPVPGAASVPEAPPAGAPTDSLGCSRGGLRHDHVLSTGGLTFRRKTAAGPHDASVATPAQERGQIVGLSLSGGHRRTSRDGTRRADRVFARNGIYVRGFEADYRARMQGDFDFMLIELPPLPHLRLRETSEGEDPVLGALLRSMAAMLADPAAAAAMAAEEAALRIETHLRAAWGEAAPRRSRGALAPAQAERAKAMLSGIGCAEGGDALTMEALAKALDLSRARFFRAFRETAGVSPHQWMQERRIERARALMRAGPDRPLAEIALDCGFCDQSHFTRAFRKATGVSPGRWRADAR